MARPKGSKNRNRSKSNVSRRGRKGGTASGMPASTGTSKIGAGLLGAAIGAAVGATSAVVLSDENVRRQVGETINEIRTQATEMTKNRQRSGRRNLRSTGDKAREKLE